MYTRNFYNKNLKMAARELRKNATPAENKLWYQFLRRLMPRARRQRPMGNFIVDFYIPKAKLVIELDGGVHNDEKAKTIDTERAIFLNKSGIVVIRFKNEQVFQDFSSVCKTIMEQVSLQIKSEITKPLF